MFDEEPDGDPHGECALEIKRLSATIERLTAERDALRVALEEIAGMTYDSWTNGARAGEIARAALAPKGE